MGSCVSSYKASSSSSTPIIQPPKPSQNNEPTFLVEEETVKEVLTETPKPEPPKPRRNIKAFDKFIEEEEDTKVHEKQPLFINKGYNTSEICRLRKTIPASTSEKTGKRVNGSPIKLLKNCSFPGDIDERRDRMVHGSRKFGSMKLIQCRDQLGQNMVKEGIRRRREPGENSCRQSRSPVPRVGTVDARPFVSRSPSVRRTNRSPAGRARTTLPERGRRPTEIPAMESKRSCAKESLENPLVSLECFIFI
ncbi:uncharacterized protein LOC131605553 [Vicia villosa]|uniref:uncharacterized protein LOC131605553 n=1 Tax=Vicia villosa TaxID=3911 RepID=UPI00273C8B7C|nr:uncharacterized protein LOC131605553 [Vicia villosa]